MESYIPYSLSIYPHYADLGDHMDLESDCVADRPMRQAHHFPKAKLLSVHYLIQGVPRLMDKSNML